MYFIVVVCYLSYTLCKDCYNEEDTTIDHYRRYLDFHLACLVGVPLYWRFCFPEYLDDYREGEKLGSEFLSLCYLYGDICAICPSIPVSDSRIIWHPFHN